MVNGKHPRARGKNKKAKIGYTVINKVGPRPPMQNSSGGVPSAQGVPLSTKKIACQWFQRVRVSFSQCGSCTPLSLESMGYKSKNPM
jgi:hypothetical protein